MNPGACSVTGDIKREEAAAQGAALALAPRSGAPLALAPRFGAPLALALRFGAPLALAPRFPAASAERFRGRSCCGPGARSWVWDAPSAI